MNGLGVQWAIVEELWAPRLANVHSPHLTLQRLYDALAECYQSEEFVTVLPPGKVPHTRYVRGSNHCLIAVAKDRLPGRAIIISVIDNLVKGASG